MKSLESYDNAQEASTDLPFGAFSNETSAGSDDGTNIVAQHMQDVYYALYQILQLAGQEPNGSLENGSSQKQFLSALSNVSFLIHNSTTTYKKGAICFDISGNNTICYKSIVDNNTANLSDTTKWVALFSIDNSGKLSNAKLDSPALSGTPTAPTAASSTNNTQIATTAFVKAIVSQIKIFPDYSSGSAISFPYTATANGYVYAHCYTGDSDAGFTVNNKWVVRHRSSQYGGIGTYIGGTFPVKAGDVVRCNSGSSPDGQFYPLV